MSKPIQKWVTDCCGWDKWSNIDGHTICDECSRICELVEMSIYASDKISSCCGDDIKIIDDEFVCSKCGKICELE